MWSRVTFIVWAMCVVVLVAKRCSFNGIPCIGRTDILRFV